MATDPAGYPAKNAYPVGCCSRGLSHPDPYPHTINADWLAMVIENESYLYVD